MVSFISERVKIVFLSVIVLLMCNPSFSAVNEKETSVSFIYKRVSGFTVGVNSIILRRTPLEPATEQIDLDLFRLEKILPKKAVGLLSKDTIMLVADSGTNRFEPLDSHSRYAGKIVVENLYAYCDSLRKNQPMLILNLLARAYYNNHLDKSQKLKVDASFEQNSPSKYAANYFFTGVKWQKEKVAPDAGKNPESYFAELTESYFGKNDFYPMDYAELERYDPEGFALMEYIWGERTVAPNKHGITLPPTSLKQWVNGVESPLDEYYSKYMDANGLPVVASRFVYDEAIVQAVKIINVMLSRIPESKEQMLKHNFRIGIVGAYENITDMPENRMMNVWWPETDWDARGRGYGATTNVPLMTCGEENIIAIPNYIERYLNQSIMVHEFAHNVDFGLRKGRAGWEKELNAAYDKAKKEGLWANTYSMVNSLEYFAEGVQAWFDCVHLSIPDADGNMFVIKTRAQLKEYDITLYNLIATVMPDVKLTGYQFE